MTTPTAPRRPFITVTAAIVALALVPVLWVGAGRAQGRAAEAGDELRTARAEESAAASAMWALNRAQQLLAVAHARDEALLAQLTGSADATDASIADLAAQLDATAADADATSRELAERQDQLRQQQQGATALSQCTDGLAQAFKPLTEQQRDTGLTRLQSVVDVCRRAQAFLTTGSNDAQFPFDFADPFVVADGRTYYGYATNAVGGNVQLIRSTDLKAWTWVGEALPELPAWAEPRHTWAPSVLHRGDRWLLYYTARRRDTHLQCLGVAVAAKPTGPFADPNPDPLACQDDQGGSIDPSPVTDDKGQAYLVWKSEGETLPGGGGVAKLWAAPLTDDGLRIAEFGTRVLQADRPDEARVVEGPAMIARPDGKYWLTYSTNRWDTAQYRVDYAVCDTPLGPCTKPTDNNVLHTDDSVSGPGGAEFLVAPDGRRILAYHAWGESGVGFPNPRPLYFGRVSVGSKGNPLVKPGT